MQNTEQNSTNQQKIIDFADKHLHPYKIRSKAFGTKEIVPEYCPFCQGGSHGDKETFALSVDKGVYVCKRGSCGVTGVFSQLADYLHDDTVLENVPGQKFSAKEKTYVLPDLEIRPPTEEIYRYFESRKIPREIVDEFKIGSDDQGNIVFPFYDENKILTYIKYRKPRKPAPGEPKEWAYKGAKQILFNLQNISLKQPVYVTEGMIDAMSLYTAGLRNVVSVPSGCSNLDWIENNWSLLEKMSQIVIFGDNDDPGRQMVSTLVRRIGEDKCRIVTDYPMRPDGTTPVKDANECLYFYGEMGVLEMGLGAQEVPVNGAVAMSNVVPIDPTTVPRIKTCIPTLDRITGGLLEGGITCFVGKSGSGKSSVADQIAMSALEQGYPVFIYSGEFSAERLQEWLNLQVAGSDYITTKFDPIRNMQVPFVPYQVKERIREWYGDRLWVFDDNMITKEKQSEAILRVSQAMIRRHGVKLLVIDNLMTAVSDQEEEWRAQAEFANQLKRIAKKYGVAVILVCHARKTKSGEKLTKDDSSGSSVVVNLADLVITVQPGEIDVIKNRETGILKNIQFCYCPDSRRIYQADSGDTLTFSWNKEGVPKADPRADDQQDFKVVPPSVYELAF